jgi:serine/threonine protein kinase
MMLTPSPYPGKICIVDDDPSICVLLKTVLSKKGHDVYVTENPSEALSHLKENTPDLIISDIQMPEMNGFDFALQVKALPHLKNVPLVFLSAKNAHEDLRKGIALGVSDYLLKPIDLTQVIEMVNAQLERHTSQTERNTPPGNSNNRMGKRYRLEGQVGEGGSAKVYKAHDLLLNRPVALKKLELPRGLHPEDRQRFIDLFLKEAQILAQLQHPYIVNVLEFFEEDNACYIVMEFLGGDTLDTWIIQTQTDVMGFLGCIKHVAEGLDYAHRKGMIHRDIKPQNILIDDEGHPRLTDFGVACFADDASASGQMLAGTLAYISPEQLQGHSGGDSRSDIYAFGAMLYHILTGKVCFAADTVAERVQSMFSGSLISPHTHNPKLPRSLSIMVEQCLQVNPSSRYHTMASFQKSLQFCMDNLSEDILHQPLTEMLLNQSNGIDSLHSLTRQHFQAQMLGAGDVLTQLHEKRKALATGCLYLRHAHYEGRIYFQQGVIVGVEQEGLEETDPLENLFLLVSGSELEGEWKSHFKTHTMVPLPDMIPQDMLLEELAYRAESEALSES